MQLNEAINRGKNLLAVSIVSLAGLAFLPEFFLEDELGNRIDDGILFLLGVIAVGWYLRGNNRLKKSIVPVVLVSLALVDKIAAVLIEFKDKADVGDDFGGLILFLCATIFVVWQYNKKDEAL